MNIITSTGHNQLFRQLYAAADSTISSRHLRDMGLCAFRSLVPEEFLGEAVGPSGQLQLMFFDSDSRPDWTDVLDRLTTHNSQIMVCVVSSDYSIAARPVSSYFVRDITGYVHPAYDNLKRSCLNILTCLNRHVDSANGSLIVHGSRQEARLPLPSIHHIETVKGTHICNIHCPGGVYVLRSGIEELSEKLGPPFRQARASTTANLSNIQSFEPNPDILSFTGGISCCRSHSHRHDLSDYFRGHPGHTRVERGDGWWKSDSEKIAWSTSEGQRIPPLPFLSIPL